MKLSKCLNIITISLVFIATAAEEDLYSNADSDIVAEEAPEEAGAPVTIKFHSGNEYILERYVLEHFKTLKILVDLKEKTGQEQILDFSKDPQVTELELDHFVNFLIKDSHFFQRQAPQDHCLIKTSLKNRLDMRTLSLDYKDNKDHLPQLELDFLTNFLSMFNYLQFSFYNSDCRHCTPFNPAIDQDFLEYTQKKLVSLLAKHGAFQKDSITTLKGRFGHDSDIFNYLKIELAKQVITTPQLISSALVKDHFGYGFGEQLFIPSSQNGHTPSQLFSSCGTMLVYRNTLVKFLPKHHSETIKFTDTSWPNMLGFTDDNSSIVWHRGYGNKFYYNIATKKTTESDTTAYHFEVYNPSAIKEGCAYPEHDAGPLKFRQKSDRILFNKNATFYARIDSFNPRTISLYATSSTAQEALARDTNLDQITALIAARKAKKFRPKVYFDFDEHKKLKATIK